MDMAFAFLADHAAVPPDGKLYVLGGGINMIAIPEVPARAVFDVVGGFRFSPADSDTVHTVELRLLDADGKLVIPPATLRFQAAASMPPDQEEVLVSTVTHLAPMFGDPGRYRAEYWSEGQLLAWVGLTVAVRPQPPPGTRAL
ncbi:MAG: hypothetical protein ABR977_06760 [Candidatus Dormibacteria bacterium]|jgi:hypothetical protein